MSNAFAIGSVLRIRPKTSGVMCTFKAEIYDNPRNAMFTVFDNVRDTTYSDFSTGPMIVTMIEQLMNTRDIRAWQVMTAHGIRYVIYDDVEIETIDMSEL